MQNSNNSFTALSVYEGKQDGGRLMFSIYIQDKKLDDKHGLVAVWIRKEANKIGKAELTFKAWSKVEKEESPDNDDKGFTPGNTIRIEAGYKDRGSEAIIFEGIIIAQHLEVDKQEDAMLKVACRDFMYPATASLRHKVFEKMTDNAVLNALLKEYKSAHALQCTVGNTATEYTELVQYDSSDWDFLLLRAKVNGFFVITDGKKVSIQKPDVSASPITKLIYGENIISFKGQLNSANQYAAAEASSWSSKEQKLMTVNVSKASVNDQGEISSSALAKAAGNNTLILQTTEYTDETSLKGWATAELVAAGLSRIQGDIVMQGDASIVAGGMVALDGLAKHFNGNVFCGGVEHEIKDGNWLTTINMGVQDAKTEAQGRAQGKGTSTSSVVPKIEGLYIGKIVKIDEDPDKENKVQVEIPLFKNKESNKVWARLAIFWASTQYGAFFIPDVGDEVVVGFFDNNPGQAVVLGSMYSSKQAPANKLEAKNNIRSIVTKSKLKLEFEEEKKTITIETPGKNTIEISDDGKSIKLTDQSKNKIEMTDSGIVVESVKSISLKAKTDITIEAGASVSVAGKSAVNLKAANIEAKADAAFTAKASAKAELSAGGQAVVKGALVMIN